MTFVIVSIKGLNVFLM